jgi:hypothetical protein
VQKRTKSLIVWGLALLSVGISLIVTMKIERVGFYKPMNVHDKVEYSVQSWAQYPSIPSDDAVLEVIWAETRSEHDLPFYPEGTQNLVAKLQDDFSKGPLIRKIVLKAKDFYAETNKSGKIKSLNDLVNAVDQGPPPR